VATSKRARRWLGALAGALALLPAVPAWSVPAFAREMGVPCAVCHTVAFGPTLTPFGRNFKLHAYALGTQSTIPLSADLVASFTHTQADLPAVSHFSANNNFAVDNVDLFFAGRIADHFGAFAQVTYDGIARHTAWSTLDARYAQDFSLGGIDTLFGASLNNNPTIQDAWNSTPGWQFPFPFPRLTNGPSAQPQINGAFAQTVLGATLYTLVDNTIYLEAGGYRKFADRLQQDFGINNPESIPHIDGTAPYWRAALQKTSGAHYASVGILGFSPHTQLGQSSPGTNNYSDFGYDATYQFANGGPHTFNFDASYIHESQRLFATAALLGSGNVLSNRLNTLNVSGQYGYHQTYSLTVAYFNSVGNVNPGLFGPGPLFGSASGKPDSRFLMFQLECVPFGKATSYARPWLNLRVGVQYTDFLRINGGNSNYDGFGHSARDNNALFVYIWTAI
jgi:hypothetical protein